MPRHIIKVDRDEDLYVEWSTVVDAPTRWGPREDFVEYLQRGYGDDAANVLERVDETGTSALYPGRGGPAYGWGDDGFIVMNMDPEGWLPRERLRAFLERLTAGEPHGDLLDPFDDA